MRMTKMAWRDGKTLAATSGLWRRGATLTLRGLNAFRGDVLPCRLNNVPTYLCRCCAPACHFHFFPSPCTTLATDLSCDATNTDLRVRCQHCQPAYLSPVACFSCRCFVPFCLPPRLLAALRLDVTFTNRASW